MVVAETAAVVMAAEGATDWVVKWAEMVAIVLSVSLAFQSQAEMQRWKPNDESRPVPRVITPGLASAEAKVGVPPSDAIVLFNGGSLARWESVKRGPAPWKVANGHMEVVPHSGDIRTKQKFGDCQLHVEWCTPKAVTGEGQHRGNSGVWLMGQFEVQVLDSFHNKTYADGQAGALYAQYPPLVNASKGPGIWQTYDIIFHRPRFKGNKVASPARMTVLHNGVLIQDNVSLVGPSAFHARPPYAPLPDKLPLMLQDHANKVRFRNIWIRPLE